MPDPGVRNLPKKKKRDKNIDLADLQAALQNVQSATTTTTTTPPKPQNNQLSPGMRKLQESRDPKPGIGGYVSDVADNAAGLIWGGLQKLWEGDQGLNNAEQNIVDVVRDLANSPAAQEHKNFFNKWVIGDNDIAGDSIDWIGKQIDKVSTNDPILNKAKGEPKRQNAQPENAAPGDGALPPQRRPPEPNEPQQETQPTSPKEILGDYNDRVKGMMDYVKDLIGEINNDAQAQLDQKIDQQYKDLMWGFQKAIADEPNDSIKKIIMGRRDAAIERMNLYRLQIDSKRNRDAETHFMTGLQSLQISGALEPVREMFGIDPVTLRNLVTEDGTPTGDYLTTALDNPTYRHSRTQEIAASIAPLSDLFEQSGAVSIVSTIIDGISEYSLGKPESINQAVNEAHTQIDDLVAQYVATPQQADLLHLQLSKWFEAYAQQEQERAQLFYLGANQ